MAHQIAARPSSHASEFVEAETLQGFPEVLTEKVKAHLAARQKAVRNYLSWVNSIATDLTGKELASGALPKDNPFVQSSYHAKVMSHLFATQSPWLTIVLNTGALDNIKSKQTEFKVQDLLAITQKLFPAPPKSARLEEFVRAFGKSVTQDKPLAVPLAAHFWSLVSVFKYEDTGEVQVSLRVVNVVLKMNVEEPPASSHSLGLSKPAPVFVINSSFKSVQYSINFELLDSAATSIGKALDSLRDQDM